MKRWVMFVLVAVGLALPTAWFLLSYRPVEVEIDVGYRGEPRYNPMLAAERLLESLDIEAESLPALRPADWLPPVSDTLVAPAIRGYDSPENFAALSGWAEDGGHLVLLGPPGENAVASELAAYFGATFEAEPDFAQSTADERGRGGYVGDDDGASPGNGNSGNSGDRSGSDGNGDGSGHGNDEGASSGGGDKSLGEADARAARPPHYRLHLHTARRLEVLLPETFAAVYEDARGAFAAQALSGDGYVTLLADGGFMHNSELDYGDNAALVLDLIAANVDPGKVWLVYRADYDALWRILLDRAPQALAAALAALALWLWARAARFGPPLPPPAAARRSIGEHVRASGEFLWRRREAETLVAAARAGVLHELEHRHPGVARLAPRERARTLGRLTGIDPAALEEAFAPAEVDRPRAFTRIVSTLQAIRNKL